MDICDEIARWLHEARSVVAFTGAGISTESGIPDFRSPGGIWSQTQPVYYDDFLASAEARYEYWRQKAISHRDFVSSSPNAGHCVLAKWQQTGRLCAVITQNIDGLHQDAGSRDVVELHGTARMIACLDCGKRWEADVLVTEFLKMDRVPSCPSCGGIMKHATISFGQSLDPVVLQRAADLAEQADVFLAMGSSLVVHPAAGLPPLAKRNGARLVIINRDPTEQDSIADAVIHDSIGAALTSIDQFLDRLSKEV
jgi:NAD-dependent deacetylase